MAKEMIAMLLAGGQGSRLYALTQDVYKRQGHGQFNVNILLYFSEYFPVCQYINCFFARKIRRKLR